MQGTARHFNLRSKAFFAGLLVAFVLLLDAMAASPALHELLHQDASSAQHQCAVTLFSHGQVDSATVDVPLVTPAVVIESAIVCQFSIFAPVIENLPAGRAPPVSVSLPA